MIRRTSLLCLAMVSGTAHAQTEASSSTVAVSPPSPVLVLNPVQTVTVLQPVPGGNILRTGAPIAVALIEELTTKGKLLHVGQKVRLEVAQDILLNGRVAIPARTPVEGELTEVRNKGMWGKSGAIHLHIMSMSVNGTPVRLSGEMDSRGTTGTAGVVGAVVALPIAGFFVTGTSAQMPLNMPGRAFLEQDVTLPPA